MRGPPRPRPALWPRHGIGGRRARRPRGERGRPPPPPSLLQAAADSSLASPTAGAPAGGGDRTYVWGTQIDIASIAARARAFLTGAGEAGGGGRGGSRRRGPQTDPATPHPNPGVTAPDGAKKYVRLLQQAAEDGDAVLDVDCADVAAYDATLAAQLVKFPSEVGAGGVVAGRRSRPPFFSRPTPRPRLPPPPHPGHHPARRGGARPGRLPHRRRPGGGVGVVQTVQPARCTADPRPQPGRRQPARLRARHAHPRVLHHPGPAGGVLPVRGVRRGGAHVQRSRAGRGADDVRGVRRALRRAPAAQPVRLLRQADRQDAGARRGGEGVAAVRRRGRARRPPRRPPPPHRRRPTTSPRARPRTRSPCSPSTRASTRRGRGTG